MAKAAEGATAQDGRALKVSAERITDAAEQTKDAAEQTKDLADRRTELRTRSVASTRNQS